MELEIESALDDYYVLFRDTGDTTPIDYERRCQQKDLLIGDKASYVWGYVGKLNGEQAKAVQTKLDLEFAEEFLSSFDTNKTSLQGFSFIIHQEKALDLLAQLSPDLEFLSHLHCFSEAKPDYHFWFFPETFDEAFRIGMEFPCLGKDIVTDNYSLFRYWLKSFKSSGAFVQLLSEKTLVDGWKRTVYYESMDILRRTAAIWLIETLCGKLEALQEMPVMREMENPISVEVLRERFMRIVKNVWEDVQYSSWLPPRQLKILGECVEIVNSIRTADGDGDKNIDIYRASPPLMQAASSQGTSPIILDGQFTEQIDEPDEIPHIFSAPSGRFTPDVIIDGSTVEMEIGDTIGNPLHTSESPDSPLIAILKEQNEILKERFPLPTAETEPAKKQNELKIPGVKIDYEKVITELYENRPETILFSSDRLLACLKGLPGGENVNISESRIRHLKVWKKYRAARESGKEQYWGDMGNVTTEKKLVKERKIPGDSQ